MKSHQPPQLSRHTLPKSVLQHSAEIFLSLLMVQHMIYGSQV